MNINNTIEDLIKQSLKKLDIEIPEKIDITHPDILDHGDYTCNVSLALSREIGKNPREIAEEIVGNIAEHEYIEKIEIAGPGFINFFLSKKFYKDFLVNVIEEDDSFGSSLEKRNGRTILLEHSSPNLFKPFHVGHFVNNTIGWSLSRFFDHAGYGVIEASFPSDVSPGIAKTIWALKSEGISNEDITLQKIADAYVVGSKEYKENEQIKNEVDSINAELYEYINGQREKNTNTDIYEKGKELSLQHFQETTRKLGSNFQKTFFESEAEKIGKEIVTKNIPSVFQESDGAVIFERENSEVGVFINSTGFGTYPAKDIGLLKMKSEKYPDIEKSFVVTDVEQKQHFEMVKEAGAQISEIADFVHKSQYLQHGRMTFSGSEKISSRYGNVPLAVEVIKTVQNNILEKMKDREFSDVEKKMISERLAIGTLKYSILKVTSGKNITFDMEKDTNPEGNTATFLMYSYVRINSIIKKSHWEYVKGDMKNFRDNNTPEVERLLYRFNEIEDRVLEEKSPHHMSNFLFDLTQKFNSFYANIKILDNDNSDKIYNLVMISVYKEILKKGFDRLGIKTVEKM